MAVMIAMLLTAKYKETHENYEKIKKKMYTQKIKSWHKVAKVKIGEIKHM